MKPGFFILLFVFLGSTVPGVSQRNISKSNILFGPVFKMINTSQEIKVAERLTIQTTVRTRPPSTFKFFGLGTIKMEGSDYQPFGKTQLSAVGNMTELRVYSKKKGAMHGFYYGPYLTYMHFKLKSASFRGNFTDENEVVYAADVSHVVKLNMSGVGFQIGTQGVYANNRFAVDWTILGFGFGLLGFQGGIEAENTSDNFDFRNYPEDVAKVKMGIEKVFHFKRTIEPTSIYIGAKVPWLMLRMGVSMGFGY